jgi:hypothetical protein
MFKRRTLFVLGAGASHEANLPVGMALAQQISKKMDVRFQHFFQPVGTGDFALFDEFRRLDPGRATAYQEAAWLIRDGIRLTSSIDDFLDQHQGNEEVQLYGKAATVKSILEAEQNSLLYFKPFEEQTIDFKKLEETWYLRFIRMLGRGLPRPNVRQIFDNVSFVVFNYDRCLEHFLRNAVQVVYGISPQDAEQVCSDLQVVHPYGSVGNLPMQGVRGVPFGGGGGNYIELAQGIKTYTEQISDAGMLSVIAKEVLSAETIVFLGFAFHDQNMRILSPGRKLSPITIYGTSFGMSDEDARTVARQIAGMLADPNAALHEQRIKIDNRLRCADLFGNFQKSLPG